MDSKKHSGYKLGKVRDLRYRCGCKIYPGESENELTMRIYLCKRHKGIDVAEIPDWPSKNEMFTLMFLLHRRIDSSIDFGPA